MVAQSGVKPQNVSEQGMEIVREIGWDKEAAWSIIDGLDNLRKYRWMNEDDLYNTIVYSDAAQSGSQIISMITGDESLQAAVNISDPASITEEPADYYQTVVDYIKDHIEQVHIESSDQAMKLARRKLGKSQLPPDITLVMYQEVAERITRKTVKRNTMTIPYNLTVYGAVEQLLDDFPDELNDLDACIIAAMVRNAVFSVFPQLQNFLNSCSEHVKGMKAEERTVFIQSQFLAAQVDRRRDESVDLPANKESVRLEGSKPDWRKIQSSHAPNVVHSIDASIVHWCNIIASMINDGEGNIMPMVSIHDSMGTSIRFLGYLPIVQRLATILAVEEFLNTYISNVTTMKADIPDQGMPDDAAPMTMGPKLMMNILVSPYNYDLPILTNDEAEGIGALLEIYLTGPHYSAEETEIMRKEEEEERIKDEKLQAWAAYETWVDERIEEHEEKYPDYAESRDIPADYKEIQPITPEVEFPTPVIEESLVVKEAIIVDVEVDYPREPIERVEEPVSTTEEQEYPVPTVVEQVIQPEDEIEEEQVVPPSVEQPVEIPAKVLKQQYDDELSPSGWKPPVKDEKQRITVFALIIMGFEIKFEIDIKRTEPVRVVERKPLIDQSKLEVEDIDKTTNLQPITIISIYIRRFIKFLIIMEKLLRRYGWVFATTVPAIVENLS